MGHSLVLGSGKQFSYYLLYNRNIGYLFNVYFLYNFFFENKSNNHYLINNNNKKETQNDK